MQGRKLRVIGSIVLVALTITSTAFAANGSRSSAQPCKDSKDATIKTTQTSKGQQVDQCQ